MFGNYLGTSSLRGRPGDEKRVKGAAPPSRYTKASTSGPSDATGIRCQKCLKLGHYSYDCKNETVYKARPSRTQQLLKPKKLPGDRPSVAVPVEFGGSGEPVTSSAPLAIEAGLASKILGDKEKGRARRKRSYSTSSSGSSDSSSSDSSSDSDSSDSDSSGSISGSSRRSRSRAKGKRAQRDSGRKVKDRSASPPSRRGQRRGSSPSRGSPRRSASPRHTRRLDSPQRRPSTTPPRTMNIRGRGLAEDA